MATKNHNLSEYNAASMPDASDMAFGIVVSDWNAEITHRLLRGCVNTLVRNGVQRDNILVHHVPGAFELTYAARLLADHADVDAVIGLGCIIRGETPHFDFIAQGVSQGFARLNSLGEVPFIFGVLTDNTIEQSRARSGGALGNKGDEAAVTAIRMVSFSDEVASYDLSSGSATDVINEVSEGDEGMDL